MPCSFSLSVNNIAKTSAWNLLNTNIRVNSICPGLVEVRLFNSNVNAFCFQPPDPSESESARFLYDDTQQLVPFLPPFSFPFPFSIWTSIDATPISLWSLDTAQASESEMCVLRAGARFFWELIDEAAATGYREKEIKLLYILFPMTTLRRPAPSQPAPVIAYPLLPLSVVIAMVSLNLD